MINIPYSWLGAAAVLLGALSWGVYEKASGSAVRLEFSQYKEKDATARAGKLAALRTRDAQLAKLNRRLSDERTKGQLEVARRAALFDAAARERDGLRDQLEEYARGGTADTLASCNERATRLGKFVDDGLRVQEALAGRAEACAVDLRALRAWNLNPDAVAP